MDILLSFMSDIPIQTDRPHLASHPSLSAGGQTLHTLRAFWSAGSEVKGRERRGEEIREIRGSVHDCACDCTRDIERHVKEGECRNRY